jgi:hypothetical protein
VAADPAAAAARVAGRAAAAAQEAQDAAQRTAQARKILAETEPLTRRSAPLAAQYLIERRKITQWQPDTLRWHPHCPWGLGTAPCIVVPVENVAGEVTGIWRIRPVMEGDVPRKGLGAIKGGCARVIDHAGLDVIYITEGVEDALSVWVLRTYPAWAALSSTFMEVLELPKQFEQVTICADAEPRGREAARTLARPLMAEGRQVRIIQPKAGKDPNDVLLARRTA